ILNQFGKKAATKSRRLSPKLGAKRRIKKSVGVGMAKASRQSLGKVLARGTRPMTRFVFGAAKGLGKLATLILIGRL
ncbi:MAG: hypothetical protein ACKN8Y_02020, partial [Polynucleobacter victoriensis]